MKKQFLIIIVTVVGSLAGLSAQAQTVVDWTFENFTSSSGETSAGDAAEVNNSAGPAQATGSHASGSVTYSAPSGNGSAHSYSSNYWSVGDYYQFTADTVGFSNINLTFDQYSSSTGPANFTLEYSLDGANFTSFASYSAGTTAFSAGSAITADTRAFDLSSITALNNDSIVYFRLADANTMTASGGTVATTGTDRVDNVIVSDGPIAVPEPPVYGLVFLGLTLSAFLAKRRGSAAFASKA